jgi:hypothetical protein
MLNLLLGVIAATAEPQPTAEPLKTIVRVKSTPFCSTLVTSVFHAIEGLGDNDDMIGVSGPLLLKMGNELEPMSQAGEQFDKLQDTFMTAPGGTHETDPRLVMDNQRLMKLSAAIAANVVSLDDVMGSIKGADALKAQLAAVEDAQKKNLNTLSGLSNTFSLQDLIAKGDGTQGTINPDIKIGSSRAPAQSIQVSHNDQDVSFQDIVSGEERSRIGSTAANGPIGRPHDPTLDTDPAISVKPSSVANNPMARFYVAVAQQRQATAEAERELTVAVNAAVDQCRE